MTFVQLHTCSNSNKRQHLSLHQWLNPTHYRHSWTCLRMSLALVEPELFTFEFDTTWQIFDILERLHSSSLVTAWCLLISRLPQVWGNLLGSARYKLLSGSARPEQNQLAKLWQCSKNSSTIYTQQCQFARSGTIFNALFMVLVSFELH